jgi:HAD superfamily hydrolase (TIGR01549 family)
MANSRFRSVFLDAGGVLVTPNWQRASEALARQGVAAAPATLAAAEPFVKQQLDVAPTVRSTNDQQRGFLYFDLILARASIEANAATDAALAELKAFNDTEGAWDVVAEDAVSTLRRLRTAGCRLVVVSNTNGTLRRMFRRVGLEPWIDLVIDSQEEGVEKPDPRLFEIALERAGAGRDSTIHCGDIYQIDVVGARSAGISAVLLDSAGLYAHADCPRVLSLTEFADRLIAGEFD